MTSDAASSQSVSSSVPLAPRRLETRESQALERREFLRTQSPDSSESAKFPRNGIRFLLHVRGGRNDQGRLRGRWKIKARVLAGVLRLELIGCVLAPEDREIHECPVLQVAR